MSNMEIILGESIAKNYNYTGDNLFTFAAWKNKGYSVKKGEKAFITTQLWKSVTYKDKKTQESKSKMILTKAFLFNIDQVEKIN